MRLADAVNPIQILAASAPRVSPHPPQTDGRDRPRSAVRSNSVRRLQADPAIGDARATARCRQRTGDVRRRLDRRANRRARYRRDRHHPVSAPRKKRLDRRPRHPAQADRDQYTPLRSLAAPASASASPRARRTSPARESSKRGNEGARVGSIGDRRRPTISATRAIFRPGPAFVRTRLSVQLRAVLLSRSAGRTPSPEPSATPRPTAERACRAKRVWATAGRQTCSQKLRVPRPAGHRSRRVRWFHENALLLVGGRDDHSADDSAGCACWRFAGLAAIVRRELRSCSCGYL